jgi:hypothetical protein
MTEAVAQRLDTHHSIAAPLIVAMLPLACAFCWLLAT